MMEVSRNYPSSINLFHLMEQMAFSSNNTSSQFNISSEHAASGKNMPIPSANNRMDSQPNMCYICHKCFDKSTNLLNHMKTHVHSNDIVETDFPQSSNNPVQSNDNICGVCGEHLKDRDSLLSHLRLHTGAKLHECMVCMKGFSNSYNLSTHMKQHTVDKPYRCDICNKQFNVSSSLARHMMMHTGNKPYKCEYCDKRFMNKSYLSRHKKLHTGELLYKCEACGKYFSENRNVAQQMRPNDRMKFNLCNKCLNKGNDAPTQIKNVHNKMSYRCDM